MKNFIFLFLFVNEVYSIIFNINVKPNKIFCIGEYLIEDKVAIFSMISDMKNIIINLNGPNNNNLYSKSFQQNVRVSLTASESGNYEMCIQNYDKKEAKVLFEFLSGLNALDSSELAKESSIKPAEACIKRLDYLSKNLITDSSSASKEEEKNLKANDDISSKINLVSVITLVTMVAIGIFDTFYIKKYMQHRKLI